MHNPHGTPLHAAIIAGHVEQAIALLNAGTPIDAQCSNGWTPLWLAASSGDVALVQLLLQRGASRQIADHDGLTPTDAARLCQRPAVLALLQDTPVPRTQLAHTEYDAAVAGTHAPLYAAITARTLNVEARCPEREGRTLLHAAVLGDHPKLIYYLVTHGATCNPGDNALVRPLHLAAKLGNHAITAVLLDLGADPHATDAAGNTSSAYRSPPTRSALPTPEPPRPASPQSATPPPPMPTAAPLNDRALQAWQRLIVPYLFNERDINAGANNGHSLLHQLLATQQPIERIRLALRLGADVHTPDWRGLAPIRSATLAGAPETIALLAQCGARSSIVGPA